MLVKFLKPYGVFTTGQSCDMTRAKATELKAQGIIIEATEEKKAKYNKAKAVVPSQTQDTETKEVSNP